MTTGGERSEYAVSLAELERSTRVPLEDQVTTQPAGVHEDAMNDFDARMARFNSIERAG